VRVALKAGENKAYGKHDREQSIAIAVSFSHISTSILIGVPQRKTNAGRVWDIARLFQRLAWGTANVSGRQSADETAACAIRYTPVDIFFFITTGNQADNIPIPTIPKKGGKREIGRMQNQAQIEVSICCLKIYEK